MTKQTKWLVAMLIFAMFAPCALHAEDDAGMIRHVLDTQQADWNRGDIESFLHGYKDSPETTFIGQSVRKGYQSILENYRKRYPGKEKMGTLVFSEIDVKVLPSECGARFALVTGRFHLDRSEAAGGEASGVFDLVWEKTGNGWKIILDHTS